MSISNLSIVFSIENATANSNVSIECLTSISNSVDYKFDIINPGPVVQFKLSGKTDMDTVVGPDGNIHSDLSFTIKKLLVENILIDLSALMTLMYFEPNYRESERRYFTQNQIPLRPKIYHESSFYHNGVLSIETNNFFSQYHDNVINRVLNNPISHKETINDYFGISSKSEVEDLQKIFNQLCAIKKS